MPKLINEMTDEELKKAYGAGKKWVTNREQVGDTKKNGLGLPYDHQEFLAGLKRIEALEDEMKKRKIDYA